MPHKNEAMRQRLWRTARNQHSDKDATSEGCIKTGFSLWKREELEKADG